MATPIESARWRLWRFAEAPASPRASASCYSCAEDIGVVPIVVAELEFGDVQREILLADLVIAAHNAALDERPEAFNRVRVDRADHVIAERMVNRDMRIGLVETLIRGQRVRHQKTDLVGNGGTDEIGQRIHADVLNYASHDVTPALDRASDSGLPRARAATPTAAPLAVLVASLSADECLIDLNNADELLELGVLQRRTDAMAHIPSRLVGAEAHISPDLPRANALLGGQHEMDHAEPRPQVDIGIFENSAGDVGKPIGAPLATVRALPVPFAGREGISPDRTAAWANHAIGPAVCDEVGIAGILIRERRFPLGNGQLMDLFALLGSGHRDSPCQEGIWHL
jgi:hypothetical protein